MKRVNLLLFAALLFFCGTTKAQTFNLRIDSSFLTNFPNTVNLNDSFAVNITIHNDSLIEYSGRIYFGSQVNGDTSIGFDSIEGAAFYYPTYAVNETIPAGGAIQRSIIVHVINPPYIIGSSGVVIWPIAYTNGVFAGSADTLRKAVTVLYPLGINEIDNRQLNVYLSGHQLIIQEDDRYLLKNVKLYDITGALLTERNLSVSGVIDMQPFAPGIYIVEINYADNARRVVKVLNAR